VKLVLFGTGSFAVPTLRRLHDHVVLVVTQPDRPSGRGRHLQRSPIREVAEDLGIAVATPEKARAPEFVQLVQDLAVDALVVASYGQILSQALLDTAKHGGINLHGSLLPKYRGAAPIQRAIQAGDLETGVTLMQMDKGMDTGDIIAITPFLIEPEATYGEVQDSLAEIAATLAEVWMPRIVAGNYPREKQNNELATIAPKVDKAEAELVFDRNAREEHDRFRAFTPSPGAFIRTGTGIVRISAATLGSATDLEPGTVASTTHGCEVAFEGRTIQLLEVQPEGKKRMSGRDFANGLRLRAGSRLN